MTRISDNQKLFRMMKLMRALRVPHIARLMALRGFDAAEYERGWDLLRRAYGPDVVAMGPAWMFGGASNELIDSIDQWENLHFDIADATLRHAYPALHARLFLNLSKTSGPEVILNVETFLRRFKEMEAEGGPEIEEAIALLAKRGLSQNRRDAALALVNEATRLDVTGEPEVPDLALKERVEAEEEMWKWYKDWAQLARTVVRDKRIRVYMGVSERARGGGDGEDGELDDSDVPVAPVPVVTPVVAPAPVPVVPPGANGPGTPVHA